MPPESLDAKAVIDGGCPDNFGFVPERVAASVAIELGVPTTIELFELPATAVYNQFTRRVEGSEERVQDPFLFARE